MSRDSELERRLENWAKEYGGGRYEHVGWNSRNMLATLIEHEGFVPDARGYIPVAIQTQADEIECAVRAMEASGMFKPGRVLRCEYFMPNSAEEVKLQNLRALGLGMSRSGYYNYLAQAKAYVAGAIGRKIAA